MMSSESARRTSDEFRMEAHRKPDERTDAARFDRYARKWFLFGAALFALSVIVATGLWDRDPIGWILGIPAGVGCMGVGVYFHLVGKRGGWARTEE
jgi:hypothetical protein